MMFAVQSGRIVHSRIPYPKRVRVKVYPMKED
jgi:hypothetical protein